MSDDDSPSLTDDELAHLFTNWLKSPFEVHPALLRLLIRRFLTLAADRAEHELRVRPGRAWAIHAAVSRHIANGVPPTAAWELAAKEMKISVGGVKQALRRVRRQMQVDITGQPLDPDHPWYDPDRKPRWR